MTIAVVTRMRTARPDTPRTNPTGPSDWYIGYTYPDLTSPLEQQEGYGLDCKPGLSISVSYSIGSGIPYLCPFPCYQMGDSDLGDFPIPLLALIDPELDLTRV